jgi:divalent metal cation (Fe/Co/Zn/Cd) transporter
MLVNTVLALVKLVAGLVGNAYVLVADAVESIADVFSSLVVIGGLHIASREADEDYPFGYGKAEALAGAIVALVLIGAAVGITLTAIREIRTPHHTPAPFTLIVLVLVIGVKELLFRRVTEVGEDIGSTAVKSDAALFAAAIIVVNAIKLLRPAIHDLMDRSPPDELLARISAAALGADDVHAIEKLKVRKVGLNYTVDLHVQADPAMSLHAAHIVSGKVKSAIRAAVPEVTGVLIHMEPHEAN